MFFLITLITGNLQIPLLLSHTLWQQFSLTQYWSVKGWYRYTLTLNIWHGIDRPVTHEQHPHLSLPQHKMCLTGKQHEDDTFTAGGEKGTSEHCFVVPRPSLVSSHSLILLFKYNPLKIKAIFPPSSCFATWQGRQTDLFHSRHFDSVRKHRWI